MTEPNILSVVSIVVSRLKRSSDSLEVFRSVLNLSITSRASKNYLNDKLLVELNYKYVRDRTRFIINKLDSFIRNGNIDSFKIYAGLVVDQFSPLEGIRLLNNRLLYVTEHASDTFLSSYLDYLNGYPLQVFLARKALKPTLLNPQIRPNIFINTMKLSCNNNWESKMRVLLRHLLRYWNLNPNDFTPLIESISKAQDLNFAKVAHYLMGFYKEGSSYWTYYQPRDIIPSMLDPEYPEDIQDAIKVTKELAQLPIEDQPWFFGNVSKEFISRTLDSYSRNAICLVVFKGSRLFCCRSNRRKLLRSEHSINGLTPCAISNDGVVQDFELYQFFRSVVANDIEGMKYLQAAHNFDWEKISALINNSTMNNLWRIIGLDQPLYTPAWQPHPLNEYLNVVDDIHEDVVEWLIELCPLNRISFDWERKDMPDSHFNVVKKIIDRGGQISTNLWIQYIIKAMPTKLSDLKALANAWDFVDRLTAWRFVFEQYYGLSQKRRTLISETKMTVLLAWKHADGESIGFRNLPKELIREIVGYLDEPPLALVFARIFAERCKKSAGSLDYLKFYYCGWLLTNEWAIEFFATESGFSYRALGRVVSCVTKWHYSAMKRSKDSIVKLMKHTRSYRVNLKFLRFMFKYETDLNTLTSVWICWKEIFGYQGSEERMMDIFRTLLIEALKTRNRTALKILIPNNQGRYGRIPTKEQFEEKIKPKHNLPYEDALKLIEEVQKEVKSS